MKNPDLSHKLLTQSETWDKEPIQVPWQSVSARFTLSQQITRHGLV